MSNRTFWTAVVCAGVVFASTVEPSHGEDCDSAFNKSRELNNQRGMEICDPLVYASHAGETNDANLNKSGIVERWWVETMSHHAPMTVRSNGQAVAVANHPVCAKRTHSGRCKRPNSQPMPSAAIATVLQARTSPFLRSC